MAAMWAAIWAVMVKIRGDTPCSGSSLAGKIADDVASEITASELHTDLIVQLPCYSAVSRNTAVPTK